MESSDRQKIISNLVQLIKIRNPSSFYTELITRNVFSPEMLENILCEKRSPRDQIQTVFLETCKRGPEAFQNLVEALSRSGNILEARLLDPNGNYEIVEVGQDEDENLVPVGIHHFVNESTSSTKHVEDTYEMTSRPRGFALIINVIDFDGNPDLKRIGADLDSNNLRVLLEQLDYKVDVIINPRKKVFVNYGWDLRIKTVLGNEPQSNSTETSKIVKNLLCRTTGILKTFTDRFTSKTVDSCIVAIMSHGEENFWVQTSDCESMDDERAHFVNLWEDVFPRFNNRHFPMMRNKPKIFIIQSCRGDRLHRRVRLSPVPKYGSSLLKTDFGTRSLTPEIFCENHPEFNHMMILQSTIPGYVSLRHEELGSPFIQILCQSIAENGRVLCWADLVSEIAKRLQELPPIDGGPQTCTYKTVGYVKKFKFYT